MNIERENLDFMKIVIFPMENHYFEGCEHQGKQQIQHASNKTTCKKTNKIPYVFRHDFLKNQAKIDQK